MKQLGDIIMMMRIKKSINEFFDRIAQLARRLRRDVDDVQEEAAKIKDEAVVWYNEHKDPVDKVCPYILMALVSLASYLCGRKIGYKKGFVSCIDNIAFARYPDGTTALIL